MRFRVKLGVAEERKHLRDRGWGGGGEGRGVSTDGIPSDSDGIFDVISGVLYLTASPLSASQLTASPLAASQLAASGALA